jgi:hypothetical protein
MKLCVGSPGFVFTLAILLAATGDEAHAQSAGVLREVYTGIVGAAVADLTNSPSFPDGPSLVEALPTFEAPTDVDDYYGQRSDRLHFSSDDGQLHFLDRQR